MVVFCSGRIPIILHPTIQNSTNWSYPHVNPLHSLSGSTPWTKKWQRPFRKGRCHFSEFTGTIVDTFSFFQLCSAASCLFIRIWKNKMSARTKPRFSSRNTKWTPSKISNNPYVTMMYNVKKAIVLFTITSPPDCVFNWKTSKFRERENPTARSTFHKPTSPSLQPVISAILF